MRTAIRLLHLALALVGGLLLSVVSVTGSMAAFRPEIDRLHASPPSGSAGTVDRDAIVAALLADHPGARVQRLVTPEAWGGDTDEWWLRHDRGTPETSDDEAWKVYSDPANGERLGTTRDSRWSATLAWLAKFHHDLWLKEIGGILVGSAGLCLMGFVLTGLWLWWPGLTRWRSGFTLRWSQGSYLRHYDLHKLLGLIGIPLFLLTALTGTMFEFTWMRALVHGGLGGSAADLPIALRPKDLQPKSGSEPGEIRWSTAVAAVTAAVPDGRLLSLSPPRGKGDGTWMALLATPSSTGAYTGVGVQLDRHTGAVLSIMDPKTMSLGGWLNSQVWGLHTGTWGGMTTRILHTVSGLIPPILLFTGIVIWLHRRRNAQQVAGANLPAAPNTRPEAQAGG